MNSMMPTHPLDRPPGTRAFGGEAAASDDLAVMVERC